MSANLAPVVAALLLISLLAPQQDAPLPADGQRHEQGAVDPKTDDADHTPRAGVIGIQLGRPELRAVVAKVFPGGAADEAGMKLGAIIVALNDEPIENAKEFMAALRAYRPGDIVAITLDSQEVLDVTLDSWRDSLNRRYREFHVDGATRLSKVTICGLELEDAQVPGESRFPAKSGVRIVEYNPDSESALGFRYGPFPMEAGDVIRRVGQHPVEDPVDLIIALLGASMEEADVRIICLKGYGLSSGRVSTGTYPFRLSPECVEDLHRVHASLSHSDEGTERGE